MGAADKGKKLKLADRADGDDSDHVDGELMLSVERLQEIQDDLEKINEEANKKVLEVEQKYNEIRRPTYKKRNETIQAIPDFWLTAFLSHPAITDLITEEDQKVLKYMVSLDVEDFKEDKPGYSITFNFAANPYFEDVSLTKTLLFSDEGSVDITGTKIKWKEGKDITKGVAQEKKGKKRPLSEESFFSWFSEDDDNSSLEGVFDMVAEIIKEDLWPNPLRYFNNEIDQEDSDEEEDGEGKANGECESSEEDEDEEEDGDEDEDEDDS